MKERLDAILVALVVTTGGARLSSAAPITAVPPRPLVPVAGRNDDHDWPKYCGNLAMTGQARNETKIGPESVSTMELLWQVSLPGAIASSPTVVSGRVYVGDWSGTEWALDAATGHAVASVNLGTTNAPQCNPPVLGITSAPAFDRGMIFLAGGDDSFYALDAATLATRWKTKLGDNSASGGYYGWSSPSPVGGRIYQGISSNCDDPFIDGRVVAMDAVSGAIAASADLSRTSDPSHFGAGVWSSPAIDLDSRSVFVTTASAYHYSDGLSYSIVSLSLDDLSIRQSWKITNRDYLSNADADWGSSPTLFHDAEGRLLVGASQKDGNYYAFDRSNLLRGPVWTREIANGGGCPQCGQGSISTASFDGIRLYVGGGAVLSKGVRYSGAVTSLNPQTGKILWRTFLSDPVLAPVSGANGVVFTTAGNSCVALDDATGDALWKADAAAPIYGGVAISDGRIFFGDTSGALSCYAITGSP